MVNRRVSVTVDADVNPYNRGVLSGVSNTQKWVRELESADGRMAALVQTSLALVPAIAPIGAAAVPALAGLTNQLGFAVIAGGTAVLAFQGVGDALTKLNEYQMAPTSKNLEELNEKLDALGPAGEVFVRELQDVRDELQGLQDAAQENMLPGVTEGIESALTQLPRFEGVIESVSSALGRLAADAGADLASPEWSEFFEYLEREAAPTLEATGKALGNLIEGTTNLVMALDPLSDDWTQGLLEASEAFVAWSDGLDSSEGYEKFVAYVQESGPQVMDTLGAIAGAMIEFVEAAAPVGAVVLPVLEVLADALAAIADSPAGPVIVGAAAAVGTLGRSLALLDAVGLRGGDSLMGRVLGVQTLKSYPAAARDVTAATDKLRVAQEALAVQGKRTADAQFALLPTDDKRKAVREYATLQGKVRDATEGVAAAERERSAAMRASAAQMGKTAAAVGGLALLTTGVADGMGLSNTMSLALMGTLAGPGGAALGATAGLLLDVKDAGDEAAESMDRLRDATKSSDPTGLNEIEASIAAVRKQANDLADPAGFLEYGDYFGDIALAIRDSNTQRADAIAEGEDQAQRVKDTWTNVAMALGEDFKDSLGRNVVPTLDQLSAAADRARPAMEALGITADDLVAMDHDELVEAAEAIAEWTTNADSAEGRTQAVAAAFRQLDNDMVDTSTSAEQLKNTLDALLGPGLSLSAATDAWRDGLRNLNDELDKNKGSLFDNTDAASQNREVIRGMVTNSTDLLVAQANAGTGARQLSKNLKNQREALLEAGDAAGISRKEMNKYLTTLGLTPDMIQTIVKAETREAMANINGFKFRWDQLKSKTIYLNTVETRSGAGGQRNGYDPSAFGNVFPTVQSFAWGDVANGHQPELAGPGPTRVWREPETQGEAYIPLANDARRPRARSILEDTAGHLGGSVEWYANGGSTGKPKKRNVEADEDANEARDQRREEREEERARREERAADAREQEAARLQRGFEEMLAGQEKATSEWISAAETQKSSWQSIADDFASKMDSIGAAATAPFKSALFGDAGDIWGNGGGWQAALDSDIAGLTERDKLIDQLAGAGISTAAIQALFDEGATNQQIAAMLADGSLATFDQKIQERDRLTTEVATSAGEVAYGAQYAAAAAQVDIFSAALATLNQNLAAINAQQNPMSDTESAAYRDQTMANYAAVGAAAADGIINGGDKLARRGTSAY